MSGISSILEHYCPTHKYDYETKRFAPNLNFFSDLMAEQAELAKKGGSKLTQKEIEDFLNFLYDKDVIERPPSFDCDHEIIAVHSGDLKAEILAEGAEAEEKWGENADLGPRGVVRFLCPCLDEMYEKLLAEQAATKVLQCTGRMDSARS